MVRSIHEIDCVVKALKGWGVAIWSSYVIRSRCGTAYLFSLLADGSAM